MLEPPTLRAAQPEGGASDVLGRLWAACSCWIVAVMFFLAWWWPMSVDHGRWVKLGVGILVIEFLVMHSSAFLISVSAAKEGDFKRKSLIRLGALYAFFGGVIALSFHSWEILASFVAVMSGRFWSAWVGGDDANTAMFRFRAAAATVLYIGLVFLTILLPVPQGGITPAVMREVWPNAGTGLWQRHPETALATGAMYFLLLGLIEARRVGPRSAVRDDGR